MQQKIKQQIGLLRSLFIYYGIPFRGRRLINFYRPIIQPGDLCFDVGSHVGNRLRAWSILGAKIIGLEPQPHLMKFLNKWYGRNQNIVLLQTAVGATCGETEMFMSPLTPTVTSLSKTWINEVRQDPSFENVDWNITETVQLTTLDRLIEQYGLPKICKIDVEGYELEVLKGLSQPIPLISFEYIPAAIELSSQCLDRLSELGQYEFNWTIGERYDFCSNTWVNHQSMIQMLKGSLMKGRSGDIYARQV